MNRETTRVRGVEIGLWSVVEAPSLDKLLSFLKETKSLFFFLNPFNLFIFFEPGHLPF